tara:strand:- start:870 stop:989 length:120 start_codon:yes stop_codon:yes gene_type:complete
MRQNLQFQTKISQFLFYLFLRAKMSVKVFVNVGMNFASR